MVSCPNCEEKSRDTFKYCRKCGSALNGEVVGDFKTDMLNVFRHDDGYIYVFAVKGNQDVIKSDTLEELEEKVCDKKYPWEFRDWKNSITHSKPETHPSPKFTTSFLKASSLKEPEIIPTSSTRQNVQKDDDESYVPDYEVSRVVETSIDFSNVKAKRNPNRDSTIAESEISTEFGIRGVFRHDGKWAFRTDETSYAIHDDTLKGLKLKVESKGYGWQITDSDLADAYFDEEKLKSRLNDERILKEREENEEFWQEKQKLVKEFSKKRQEEIEKKLSDKNMDNMLR